MLQRSIKRFLYQRKHHKQTCAAVLIQKTWKGYHDKRAYQKVSFKHDLTVIGRCQSMTHDALSLYQHCSILRWEDKEYKFPSPPPPPHLPCQLILLFLILAQRGITEYAKPKSVQKKERNAVNSRLSQKTSQAIA